MSHKHLLFRSEAREKVLRGAAAIADARMTWGILLSILDCAIRFRSPMPWQVPCSMQRRGHP